ncbi:winged helix-turn-helix domain-containing protein [Thermoleophilia bacterium SCSIO 60948]|nr:winged helix-turn-helix domain-containing protein [Thermoleophilia bacterium SCSIO 60948]
MRVRISASEARRIALGAQGFADPPASGTGGHALRRVVSRTKLLQIDSVNVLERAHYLPIFSRIGPYPHATLDDAAFRAPRRLFEYWAHEASLLPVTTQPLLRWRMAKAYDDAWGGMRRIAAERPELVEEVYEQVAERGPIAASELAERERRAGPWWDWSETKHALEYLFWSGRITSARRVRFERRYDLTERVLPRAVVEAPTPDPQEAQRELLRISASALGVMAESDLRDYFRLSAVEAKPRVAELVEAGDLLPVEVEGWGRTQGYLWRDVRIPRRVDARALLAPFDPVVWARDRTRRIFGFDFRLEIYVPQPKRVHGYYVLPFLLGDRLVGRCDLKADRRAGVLRCHAVHLEAHADRALVMPELEAELRSMASWLGLGGFEIARVV